MVAGTMLVLMSWILCQSGFEVASRAEGEGFMDLLVVLKRDPLIIWHHYTSKS